MSRVEEITNELMIVDSEIAVLSSRIQGTQGEITNLMSKVQSGFGVQQAGQQLIATLQRVLHSLIFADSSLHIVKTNARNYIQIIRK